MDEIKIYKVSKDIYDYYIKNVRIGKDATYNAIKRKLNALILSCKTNIDLDENIKLYKIGKFHIYVNESSIIKIDWTNEWNIVDSEQNKKILYYFKNFKLSEDGNRIIS